MRTTHTCPRKGCHVEVPNSLYACYKDWKALSFDARNMIARTRSQSLLSRERLAAFAMAKTEWSKLDE